MRISALLFVLLIATMTSCEAQRVKAWKEDVDYWMGEAKIQHYIYRNKPLPQEVVDKAEWIKSNIDNLSDQRMLIEILGLAAMLGDGHTYVLPFGAETVEAKVLPIRLYNFADGLYVIDAYEGFEKWIGKQIVRIGTLTPKEIFAIESKYISRDNEQGVNWIGPFLLPFEGMLQACGVTGNGEYKITFEVNGQLVEQLMPVTNFRPTRGVPKLIAPKVDKVPAPLYLQNVNQTFVIKALAKDKSLYVQFNQVMNDPKESLSAFSKRLADSINRISPRKLIIDVRHNNGGNADLLDPLLNALVDYKSKAGTQLYFLTGRNTFSAAQIFISRADKMLKPIFAGEVSSSKPNFVGEENGVMLPNSKAICSISNRYHESIPGDNRLAIEPSIVIPPTAADYFAGRDAVLEAVLAQK